VLLFVVGEWVIGDSSVATRGGNRCLDPLTAGIIGKGVGSAQLADKIALATRPTFEAGQSYQLVSHNFSLPD
jgi:hypothetical protein